MTPDLTQIAERLRAQFPDVDVLLDAFHTPPRVLRILLDGISLWWWGDREVVQILADGTGELTPEQLRERHDSDGRALAILDTLDGRKTPEQAEARLRREARAGAFREVAEALRKDIVDPMLADSQGSFGAGHAARGEALDEYHGDLRRLANGLIDKADEAERGGA